jgi:5-methylcytosine-specific restriction enzyme B
MREAFGASPDLTRLGRSTVERIEYFEHPNRNNAPGATMPRTAPEPVPRADSLTPVTQALRQFRQVILYGPPGTGKTRLARRAALALLENHESVVPSPEDEASVSERLSYFRKQGDFDLVVFHPAYEYEQFMGGITPQPDGGNLSYTIAPGIFLKMARWVEKRNMPAVLIIDEINRGNLPKLLGELLYALEYRNEEVRLPFEWEGRCDLVVPKDLYIVGTMNSSDRSIGHIDVAVRRRFGLLHIEPDAQIVRNCWQDSDPALGDQLANLMVRLNQALKREDPGGELLVGHAYFLADGYRALFVEKRAILHSLERTDERPW